MLSKDIAIDLGTSNIRIFIPEKGIVIDEPSVVSVSKYDDGIIAIGKEAYNMIGKTSDKISVLYPLENGVISDFSLVEQMIRVLLKRIRASIIVMPRAVACIPGEVTEVEKMAVVNAISTAGVRKVCLIEEPIAAALGAGIDIFNPHGYFVVDIGGGTTDIAVISLGGVAAMKSIKTAGKVFDDALVKYIRRKYGLIVGQNTAENIKKSIGQVYPSEHVRVQTAKGRNALTGLPQAVEINSDETLEAFSEIANQIVSSVKDVLEEAPPELVGDILSDGITLTGGCANINGFDELISSETKLKVTVANRPELCVVLGAGEGLKYIDALENRTNELNPLIAEY